jgi:hypothetical protein
LAPIAPALLLSAIIGALYTCVYVLLRGRLRLHVLLVLPAAIVGAWLGQAVGTRLGDPVRLGDYSILWASLGAWAGIGLVVLLVSLLPGRGPREPERP